MKYRAAYFVLVITALGIYLISLFSPLMTVSKFLFLSDTVTLVSVLSTLWNSREIALFIIIVIFTIFLPLIKFCLLIIYGINPDIEQRYKNPYSLLEIVSRWAMLDVFVAALLVVVIKIGLLSSAATHYGLYLFICSVLLSMFCAQTRRFWVENNN